MFTKTTATAIIERHIANLDSKITDARNALYENMQRVRDHATTWCLDREQDIHSELTWVANAMAAAQDSKRKLDTLLETRRELYQLQNNNNTFAKGE